MATLAPAWATAVGSTPSDPVTTADGVFVTTADGTAATVHALDADDGAQRWEATLYDNTIAPPTEWSGAYVQGGEVIAGWSYYQYRPAMNEAGTARFDPITGERGDSEGGPVAAVRGDRSVHLMVQNLYMYPVTELAVVDADDPATSWSGYVGASVASGAVIGDDGTVFVTGWGPASPTPTTGAPLVWGLRSYAPAGTNGCVGLFPRGWDPTPVQPIDLRCPAWVAPLSGRLSARVISRATGELLVASNDGSVHGVDQATGALRWSAPIGANGTTPALDTGAGLVHVPLAGGGRRRCARPTALQGPAPRPGRPAVPGVWSAPSRPSPAASSTRGRTAAR